MYTENILRLLPTKLSQNVSLPLLAEQLLHSNVTGIDNVVGTTSEILLFTNMSTTAIRKELKSVRFSKKYESQEYKLPICFSKGAEWDKIVSLSGQSKSKLIDTILQSSLSLCMYGFLPGFMYLEGLAESLHIPRKTIPSKKVLAGSFSLGGPYAGIYNIESPGGWHVIGNCPVQLFNTASIQSPFINIGDTFSIQKITVAEWKKLKSDPLTIKDYN